MEKYFWENGVLSSTILSGNPYINNDEVLPNPTVKIYDSDKEMKVEDNDG